MNRLQPVWIVGFDATCRTCRAAAAELAACSAGKLATIPLDDPEVRWWRAQALGPNAPDSPTLFPVDGDRVRAWVGLPLVLQLHRLLGFSHLWRVATAIGALVDQPRDPASPVRRVMLHRGLSGLAATVALLGGAGGSHRTTLAQGSLPTVRRTADGGSGTDEMTRRQWSITRLRRGDARQMERRSEGHRDFTIIRDYFADKREWRRQGRDIVRLNRNDRKVRDTYMAHYQAPGRNAKAWVHVTYGREADGKDWAYGFLWRNGRYTDKFFVQNGNLRRVNGGRVAGAATLRESACAADATICEVAAAKRCGIATAYAALFCVFALPGNCVATDGIMARCKNARNEIDDLCRELPAKCA